MKEKEKKSVFADIEEPDWFMPHPEYFLDRPEKLPHAKLEALKKELGFRSIENLVCETKQNDPFFMGTSFKPDSTRGKMGQCGSVEKARWILDMYEKMGSPVPFHIRRIHYWIDGKAGLKPDGTRYANIENDNALTIRASKAARYLGLIPYGVVEDRRVQHIGLNAKYHEDAGELELISCPNKLELPEIYSPEDVEVPECEFFSLLLPDYEDGEVSFPLFSRKCVDAELESWESTKYYDAQKWQPYHLELWEEKSTMQDITKPICERYNVNHIIGMGDMSLTMANDLMERVQNEIKRVSDIATCKPVRIFYISDFDPQGENMPYAVGRKLEWFVRTQYPHQNLDIKLKPIVLTKEQCKKYNLPSEPPKEKGGSRFLERRGMGRTELDALEANQPGELARILEEAIEEYCVEDIYQQLEEVEKKNLDSLKTEISEKLLDRRDDIDEIRKKFEPIEKQIEEINKELDDELSEVIEEYNKKIEEIYDDLIVGLNKQIEETGEPLIEEYDELMQDIADTIEVDFEEPEIKYTPPEEGEEWVYDSSLRYLAQIERYNKLKGIEKTICVCGAEWWFEGLKVCPNCKEKFVRKNK